MKSTSMQLKNLKKVNKDQDDLINILTEDYDSVNAANNEQDKQFAQIKEKIEELKSSFIHQTVPTKELLIEYFKTMAGFEDNIKTIYFNDSTEENPAKINGGQTYNIINPFTDKTVTGRAEIFYDNEWVEFPSIQIINKSDNTIDVVTPAQFVNELTEVKARLKLWAVDMVGVNIALVDNALVGEIKFTISKTARPGWLPLIGETYSREQYASLWQWAQNQEMVVTEEEWQTMYLANNGNVTKFSSGDDSTTFRLPSIKAWTKSTDNLDEVGTYLKPGLPNINGTFTLKDGVQTDNPTGAISAAEDGNNMQQVSSEEGQNAGKKLQFNASKYNGIYGNSDQVQPASVVGLWVIKAYENTVYDANDTTIQNLMQVADKSFVSADVVEGALILTTNKGETVRIEGISGSGNTLGKETVGGEDTPIYLLEGVPTAGRKLGSAAYKGEDDFASSDHTHDEYLAKSGGELTGPVKGQTALGTTGSDTKTGLVLEVAGVSANTGIYNGNGTDEGQADMFIKAGKTVGFVDGETNKGMTVSIDTQTGNVNLSKVNGSTPLTTGNYVDYTAKKAHKHTYEDITGQPELPTKLSEFENDEHFIKYDEVGEVGPNINSGDAFPTTQLYDGKTFFRTDLGRKYTYYASAWHPDVRMTDLTHRFDENGNIVPNDKHEYYENDVKKSRGATLPEDPYFGMMFTIDSTGDTYVYSINGWRKIADVDAENCLHVNSIELASGVRLV